MSDLVQPIFVQRGADHEETVYAAMLASFRLVKDNRDHPAVVEWMSGRFTKTVRRLKSSDMDWLTSRGVEFPYRNARAIAMIPCAYDDFSSRMKRGQVAGTDFEKQGTSSIEKSSDTTVWVLDTLTTGKAAAQAAHALVALGDDLPRYTLPNLYFVDAPTLAMVGTAEDAVSINDSGLTEVEPGTLCAVGLTRKIEPAHS